MIKLTLFFLLLAAKSALAAEQSNTFPKDGYYSTAVNKMGVENGDLGASLIHPNARTRELPISATGSKLDDYINLHQGRLSPDRRSIIQSVDTHALYIVEGKVHLLPLKANGQDPRSATIKSERIGACAIKHVANPPEHALMSRALVSKQGRDGICNTADDELVQLSFNPDGRMTFESLDISPEEIVLGYLTDMHSRTPKAWVTSKGLVYFEPPIRNTKIFDNPVAGWRRSAMNLNDSLILELDSHIEWVSFNLQGEVTRQVVQGIQGTGWQGIGFDATHAYLYQIAQEENKEASSWTVVSVSRKDARATVLRSGTGSLEHASMGQARLLLSTVFNGLSDLILIDKAAPHAESILFKAVAGERYFPFAGPDRTHIVVKFTVVSGELHSNLDVISESGTLLESIANTNFAGISFSSTRSLETTKQMEAFFFFSIPRSPEPPTQIALAEYHLPSKALIRYGAMPISPDSAGREVKLFAVPGEHFGVASFMAEGLKDYKLLSYLRGVPNSIVPIP